MFLRPGLSLDDIQQRADKLAAGCWASTVIADQASASNSALVRIDIKRRDPLTGIISSPLKAVLGGIRPLRAASDGPGPGGPRPDRRPGGRRHQPTQERRRQRQPVPAPVAQRARPHRRRTRQRPA